MLWYSLMLLLHYCTNWLILFPVIAQVYSHKCWPINGGSHLFAIPLAFLTFIFIDCTWHYCCKAASFFHGVDVAVMICVHKSSVLSHWTRLLDKAVCDLFSSMCRPHHCLHHVLPLIAWLVTWEFVVIPITVSYTHLTLPTNREV